MAARAYDEQIGTFSTDGTFDPKAVAVLKKSFIEMGLLKETPAGQRDVHDAVRAGEIAERSRRWLSRPPADNARPATNRSPAFAPNPVRQCGPRKIFCSGSAGTHAKFSAGRSRGIDLSGRQRPMW